MAHHKSAKKRIRTDAKRRDRNKQYLSKVRTAIKNFRLIAGAEAQDREKIAVSFRTVQSLLARAVRKKSISKNTAARKTKRLYLLTRPGH